MKLYICTAVSPRLVATEVWDFMMTSCKYIGFLGAMIVAVAAHGAFAAEQAIDPATLPPTQAADAPASERLFGNWGGLQDDLIRQGIGIKIDALTEFAVNV